MLEIERSHRSPRSINITPLIDVVFMLMIFFVLTTKYVNVEALKLAVVEDNRVAKSGAQIIKTHELKLLASGATFLNGVLVYYGDLEDNLDVIFTKMPTAPITVKCENDVNVQMLVEVLDMVKRTGGQDVRVARLATDGESP
jgi:biopolymer transport protein ExbD